MPAAVEEEACLGDDTVALFLDGALDEAGRARLRRHLDRCDACRRLLADAADLGSSDTLPADFESRVEILAPGHVIAGKYEILRVLGAGGMAKVFEARHRGLDQHVAIKVMHPEDLADADAVQRFLREGRTAARLKNEHAVRIHDVDRLPSGAPYLVMELLAGEDLDGLLRRRGTLEVEEAVDYILQAAEVLVEAHALGLVHRDLKPHNLFLARTADGRSRVKVVDFGLAKELRRVAPGSSLTTEHMILGSPHFMSPEQARSPRDVDQRTDIWALGATLFMLLTGRPPFESPTVHGLLARILADPAPRVSSLRPSVPPHVDHAVARALEKSVDARFGDVAALVDALRPSAKGASVATERDASLPPTRLRPLDAPDAAATTPPETAPPTEVDAPRTADGAAPATLAPPTVEVLATHARMRTLSSPTDRTPAPVAETAPMLPAHADVVAPEANGPAPAVGANAAAATQTTARTTRAAGTEPSATFTRARAAAVVAAAITLGAAALWGKTVLRQRTTAPAQPSSSEAAPAVIVSSALSVDVSAPPPLSSTGISPAPSAPALAPASSAAASAASRHRTAPSRPVGSSARPRPATTNAADPQAPAPTKDPYAW